MWRKQAGELEGNANGRHAASESSTTSKGSGLQILRILNSLSTMKYTEKKKRVFFSLFKLESMIEEIIKLADLLSRHLIKMFQILFSSLIQNI